MGFVPTEKSRLHILEVKGKRRGVWRNSKANRGHQDQEHVQLPGGSQEGGRTISGKVHSVFERTGPRAQELPASPRIPKPQTCQRSDVTFTSSGIYVPGRWP